MLYLYLSGYVSLKNLKKFRNTFKGIFFVFIFLLIIFNILGVDIKEWLIKRSSVGLDGRRNLLNQPILKLMNENKIMLGYGPGSFLKHYKINPHNGFIKLVYEIGFIGVFGLFIYLMSILVRAIKFIDKAKGNKFKSNSILILFTSVFIIFTFIMNWFNEIFEYHYYWILILLLSRITEDSIGYNKLDN